MLVVVAVFFAALTTLLLKMFPAGMTLTQILEQRSGNRARQGARVSGGMFDYNKKKETVEQAAATLSHMGNDVRSKGASSIAWGPAREGMKLRDHDAIQTFSQSSAQINFDPSNYLSMGSNSLVIIKRIEKELARNERRSSVVVMDGELQGHVAGGRNALSLNITTPSALVKMQPQVAAGPRSDFRIAINPDHSSTIVVLSGEASVSAQGKTVRVTQNTGLTVKQGEAPGDPTPLPPPPEPAFPAEGSVVRYRELPQRVSFRWGSARAGSEYRLQLSRDRAFREVLLDRRLGQPEFMHGNLRKGEYFWRVSRIDGGVEGFMSRAVRFEVVQNRSAPPLEVSFPSAAVTGDRCTVAGSTAPGNRVFVGGRPVPTDESGAFSCEVPLKPGWTLVTVEAADASGNVTYKSRYIRGRF